MRCLLAAFIVLLALGASALAGVPPDGRYTCGEFITFKNQQFGQIFKDRPVSSMVSYSSVSTTSFPFFCLTALVNGTSGRGFVAFMEINQEPLWQDIAQGGGERLTALAVLMGCDTTARNALGKVLQAHFEQIVPSEAQTSEELWARIAVQVRASPLLAHRCTSLV